jgi:alpha-tubulin suppressor-like RCC1 family protein
VDPPACREDRPLVGDAVAGIEGAASLAAGAAHFCAVTREGRVRCWGEGGDGQLGDGNARTSAGAVLAALPEGVRATAVFAAGALSCTRTEDGDFYCWGENRLGLQGAEKCPEARVHQSVYCIRRPARHEILRALGP